MNTYTTKELALRLGITERSTQRILSNEKIPSVVKGGKRVYHSKDLTPKIQKLILKNCHVWSEINPLIPSHNRLLAGHFQGEAGTNPCFQGLPENILDDPRVQNCAAIVREATQVPDGWKARKWVEYIAQKHDLSPKTVYVFIAREKSGGLAAHRHTKSNRGKFKVWDEPALGLGLGLALKREHRRMSEKAIYKAVVAEAAQRGWAVGGYRSFTSHLKKRLNPLLLAIRNGGSRALDNSLPPTMRTYGDLDPFEIICGDQNRQDFWCEDDETGALFRPESYYFIDLRTRLVYGFWVGKRYNSHAMGLALRLGCRLFGGFKSLYTDNGKPELSKYISDIANEIGTLGGSVGEVIDLPIDLSDQDLEEAACVVTHNHIRAIPRNAKAKVVESFNHHFGRVLIDVFKVPGHVKSLSSSGEEQDVDDAEIKKLAAAGKLLKFSEVVLTLAKAVDYYNKQRPHRGVLKEWAWKPRPPEATPFQCLMACIQDGWRPTPLSDGLLDLAFLLKDTRTVDRGRIRFRTAFADLYEHPALAALHGQKVSVRSDPLDPGWILVFLPNSEFVCRALPIEYSSMKDPVLSQRKIAEKARLRKAWLSEYERLTSPIPDLTQYSTIPRLEITANVVKEKLRAEKFAVDTLYLVPSEEQMDAAILDNKTYESRQDDPLCIEIDRPGKKRPIFEFEADRYQFLMDEIERGAQLPCADVDFIVAYQAGMDADARDFWKIHEEVHGIGDRVALTLRQAG